MTKPAKQIVVLLSEFSLKALAGAAQHRAERIPAVLAQAVRLYLNDRESDQAGWAYPAFARGRENGGVELELILDEGLLRELEDEAGRQGLSVSQMAEQAAFYYAAELDAGRIAQRILDDQEGDGA